VLFESVFSGEGERGSQSKGCRACRSKRVGFEALLRVCVRASGNRFDAVLRQATADVKRRAGAAGLGRSKLGGISSQSARGTTKGMSGHSVIPVNHVGGLRIELIVPKNPPADCELWCCWLLLYFRHRYNVSGIGITSALIVSSIGSACSSWQSVHCP
jgi:hypothetical protein